MAIKGASGILKAGLKNNSPEAPKEKAKGASIDSNPTRKATAPTPKTQGPRHA